MMELGGSGGHWWEGADTLNAAARGQEFVANGADREDARLWLDTILGDISAAQPVKAD